MPKGSVCVSALYPVGVSLRREGGSGKDEGRKFGLTVTVGRERDVDECLGKGRREFGCSVVEEIKEGNKN